MSYAWRSWSMFGVGTLFGVVMGGVLYAPPELANQPPPWQLWSRMQAAPAVDTHASGAGPAPLAATAPVAAAPVTAAPEPVAAASAPVPEVQAPLAAASAPVLTASHTPAKRKVRVEESTVSAAAAPSQEGIRVAPEPLPAPVELAPARAEGEANADPSR
ncbi:hypothetical protein LZ009_05435 [Ramlibacter sp. XY19]|uniref:hypothetical protein n=1 Tax=Ramlibacter paludis TaxID=2908000 RepID=UPI0023DB29EF|nr:hypothetical protein [Ramlibacter paludis]MCG2592219.1 hypothetical protein [Ramlibacter paludis]